MQSDTKTIRRRPFIGRQGYLTLAPWRNFARSGLLRRRLRAHQRCAPMEAGAEPHEADQVAGLDAAALPAFVQGDGDGGCGGVPVALDVVVDAVVGEAEGALDHL